MGEDVNDTLPLTDYIPRSALSVAQHDVTRARFPAIDAHNHLGLWLTGEWLQSVNEILAVMDRCNLKGVVNLDGRWGDELEANLDRYDRAYPDRFYTFAQLDWSLLERPDFADRLVRNLEDSLSHGARGLKVWKDLGLRLRDDAGDLLAIDDERLAGVWDVAGSHDVPILIHIADPVAFFEPLDNRNERWEELHAHPDWHFYGPDFPSFETLIDQFEHVIARHPRTRFIGAHVGCYSENLAWVSRMLDTYPNFYVDIGQRISELGRQPYSSRRLFERHPDRILFGTDCFPLDPAWYAPYFRFLETDDEYFNYGADEIPGQGRWYIYGLDLPDDILQRVYSGNAGGLLGL